MQARGLLYDHHSVSRDLIERQQRVTQRRPSRYALVSKNIMYKYNESASTHREHKRTTSKKLETHFSRRGSNVTINTVNGVFVPYARMGSRDIDSDADKLSGTNNINPRLNIMSESVEDKISDMQYDIDDLKIPL